MNARTPSTESPPTVTREEVELYVRAKRRGDVVAPAIRLADGTVVAGEGFVEEVCAGLSRRQRRRLEFGFLTKFGKFVTNDRNHGNTRAPHPNRDVYP